MKKIQLWSVDSLDSETTQVERVEAVENTETERLLEDLLVQSPDMLMDGLTLVGRQLPTAGGPLDLLGIDSDGHLVVFELKRGTLTRDAVAQVIDYASDIAEFDEERLTRWIEENSGQRGIEKIVDFRDWYSQEFPSESELLNDPPKMVLVGLGVDERARRMVNFLANASIDVRLLTFHAFHSEGKLFFARQVESVVPQSRERTSSETKEGNRRMLDDAAASLGVGDLLEEARAFIDHLMPSSYCWPHKSAYTFSLPGRTSEGSPTSRKYVRLCLDEKRPNSLTFVLPPRAIEAAPQAADALCISLPNVARDKNRYSAIEISFSKSDWSQVSDALGKFISEMVAGWKQRASSHEESPSQA